MATKKQLLQEAVAKAVGAGKAVALETVDFNDPNRPKTCLEVDFPILPVNQVAIIEGNAGKPIYQMSKWWARRRSSVFRSLLIAAATEAPADPNEAAKLVWDHYYCNHQKAGSFKQLKVLDPFMGGGTTGEACAAHGRKFIGIERERRYFDLSCERIARAQAQGKLLPPEPQPEVIQAEIFLPNSD